MSLALRRFAASAAGALAVALTIGSANPALAQNIDASSVGEQAAGSAIDALGSVPVGSTADVMGSVGSADFAVGAGSLSPVGTPRSVDETITESKFVRIERTEGAYQYWLVESAAMKRQVLVEVVPSRVGTTAPALYMLDGVDSPEKPSGWSSMGKIADRMAGENVHVVTPTGAYASYFADWENVDPVLGHNKWETFLTEELPAIVSSQLEVTDKAAVGGISMGGQAAMHLAATYPELYDGVMSFSGYYSTMDQLGYQTIRLTVETRGGAIENMWGPHGSEAWRAHDTISHVGNLADARVYFSAGNGVVGEDDLAAYGGDLGGVAAGLVLERGVFEGTTAFEKALKSSGIDHRVDYSETGLHNWVNFMKNFDAGWDYIKPALQG
ncbi:alpha/beta hydrolase family protein [Dietzia sp. ANT_WB102]|uniref:alpha/beta hydrolase n=1 Tax=Dietzia sp. ANT_WB102 TaxID=2597345 RepID=UPI0011EFF1E6|nr:alpha/beta hydrolase family protein [Dietzia sp. ANT_WB102]KAA0918475.1 esterase family protein [Dietzia sp. ANT_WB102]